LRAARRFRGGGTRPGRVRAFRTGEPAPAPSAQQVGAWRARAAKSRTRRAASSFVDVCPPDVHAVDVGAARRGLLRSLIPAEPASVLPPRRRGRGVPAGSSREATPPERNDRGRPQPAPAQVRSCVRQPDVHAVDAIRPTRPGASSP